MALDRASRPVRTLRDSTTNGWCVTSAARPMQDLAGLGRAVSRLHDLLVWSLAACQCIEAEDRYAASVAAHLAGMLGEVERINHACCWFPRWRLSDAA
jgi:hypothetical protein